MLRCRTLRSKVMTNATRLQLGNLKSEYGTVSTAAGSLEKWGFIYKANRYPMFNSFWSLLLFCSVIVWSCVMQQYRDMIVLAENICYEDVKDRCLTPIPGWTRLRSTAMMNASGPQTHRDPTPLDWLPFELKLGYVRQASY
jgi:hypothetical protein